MDCLTRAGGLIAIGALLLAQAGCAGAGRAAPDFKFTTLSGDERKLSSYKGQPVVLDFFGTDCVPCMAELPRFQEAYTNNEGRFELIVLSSDDTDVQKYVNSHGYTMTFAIDHGGRSALAVTTIPHTFFINRLGRITYDQVGELSAAEFDAQLQHIL